MMMMIIIIIEIRTDAITTITNNRRTRITKLLHGYVSLQYGIGEMYVRNE